MRNVFFSFDYKDVWKANVVRKSWVVDNPSAPEFLDRSLWEESKLKTESAIKKLIDDGLQGTSVTVVLIGQRTHSRKYVRYEIEQSIARDNGIVGIHLAGIQDANKKTTRKGRNPLALHKTSMNGSSVRLSEVYKTYDWVTDEGWAHIGEWVDEAAVMAGRPDTTVHRSEEPDKAGNWGVFAVIAGIVVFVLVLAITIKNCKKSA